MTGLRFVGYFVAFVLMAFGIIGIIVLDYTPNPYEVILLGAALYIGTELNGMASK